MNARADREIQLLSRAIDALKDSTRLSTLIRSVGDENHDRGRDAVLEIDSGGHKSEYSAVIKTYLTSGMIGVLSSELRRMTPQGLLVTNYVTPAQAEKLVKLNVPFLDAAGNAFLYGQHLYVMVVGRRPAEGAGKEKRGRAFTPSGLKILFTLLCNPGLESEGYREIAATAGVSHGAVGWVMSDLGSSGYFTGARGNERRLINKRELLKRWVETYSTQLRPKLLMARYKSKTPGWWRESSLSPTGALWGGEVAAAKLTGYLRPEVVTLYAPKNLPELQARFGLRRDPEGDVEILKKFWTFEGANSDTVPPLLIYADLMASGDDRNIETAEIIYDAHLARLIGETHTP
jgi:hypothetical protein